MIEEYMCSGGNLDTQEQPGRYDVVSDEPKKRILYMSVPRRRKEFFLAATPGQSQRVV